MLRLEYAYWLVAAFLAAAGWMNLRERAWTRGALWLVLATPFAFGQAIASAFAAGVTWPAQAMGVGVVVLGVLSALAKGPARDAAAAPGVDAAVAASPRIGARALFVPALAIPLLTVAIVGLAALSDAFSIGVFEPKRATLLALAIACVVALMLAVRATRAPWHAGPREGRRLLDALGWAVVLPMLLATLGSVFAATGVGDLVAAGVDATIPTGNRWACLLAFAAGMVLFTGVTGNAFAAFPVIMAGIGLPLLVQRHGADPAVLGSIGMLIGYCGTLLTPMAANFNVVPVVLLELPGTYDVIRAQWPTALALLAINIALVGALAFR